MREAFERFGKYSDNEPAWRSASKELLSHTKELEAMSPAQLKELLKVLVENARVTYSALWDGLTDPIMPVLTTASLEELMDIVELYTKIQAWEHKVFARAIDMAKSTMAVHTEPPESLARLLDIFSRAGAGSVTLSRDAAKLFNELEDRIVEDASDFQVRDCISLLNSMARFRAVNPTVLQTMGRERLHAEVNQGLLHGEPATAICNAYGALGYRHDTVFKTVLQEVLREHSELQRARVLGEALPTVRYSTGDIVLVAFAMLRLKLYRGNTSWFRWTDRYRELVDCIVKRLEEPPELGQLGAEPLAAAAFVLGRGRRGTVELYKAMYERMMRLLESATDFDDPQPRDFLERFLHGVAMMGPDRKKDLDAEWLMQWLCQNVHTFVLGDLILVNRHLVLMGCCDKEYLKLLVPFYCERMEGLKKSDIMELTNTYNGARIREDDIPDGKGTHFFWALGRQYQRLQVESGGRRPRFRRIG